MCNKKSIKKLNITRIKDYFIQGEMPKKVDKYLNKIKDLDKNDTVYIDETGI